MTILAGFAAMTVGLSLGLLGGGGSILTVPILVYLLGLNPKTAIPISLIIVGLGALVGGARHYFKGNVRVREAVAFFPTAMVGAWVGARLALHLSSVIQMVIFGTMTIMAAFSMLRKQREVVSDQQLRLLPLIASGLGVGLLTGIVGVGGGFMIVPALIFFARMPIKYAIGTSLVIIALNSFAGFLGYLGQVAIPWGFTALFSSLVVVGILVGIQISERLNPQQLKSSFAVMLLLVGVFVLYKNFALI